MPILKDKVAVVTGSSKGLGLAIAQAFAREGAAVVLSGRSAQALQEAVAQLEQQGARASWLLTDVGDLEQVRRLAKHTVEVFGSIDIWVNNAGYASVYGPTIAIDPRDFERVVRTNILGEYYGSLVAIQQFLAQGGGGKLINLLGRGDKAPVAFQNAYGSSKAWVRNFTLALAKEQKKSGIGIFAFNPGLVETDLLRKVDVVEGYEKQLKGFEAIIRLWANPPAVPAERVVWLASSATDGKTGLEVQVLTPRKQLGGGLRELRRLLKREPARDTSVSVKLIAPYQP
ncbi:MAG: SDR family oxidoreductase [Ktedonobacteraceae bacterium]|nr:SDR family oxidoreductase [Chloroflexota bacterium]